MQNPLPTEQAPVPGNNHNEVGQLHNEVHHKEPLFNYLKSGEQSRIPVPPLDTPNTQANSKGGKGRFRLVGCIATITFLLLACPLFALAQVLPTALKGAGALAAAQGFYISLIRLDCGTARGLLSAHLRDEYSESALREAWLDFKKKSGEIELGQISEFGDMARPNEGSVTVVLIARKNAANFVLRLKLSNNGNHWNIDKAEPSLVPLHQDL